MMNLKNTSQLFMLLMSGAALAGTMGDVTICKPMKEGLYVGAGIGGGMYNDKISAYNVSSLATVNKSFNSSSALASIFAGVGKTYYEKYYLGAEANTYFPSHNTSWPDRPGVTNLANLYNTQFSVRNYVNLDLLPGVRVMPDWLVYARVGISFSDIIANQDRNDGTVNSFSNSQSKTGGRFGAGLAYQITEHCGAGVDYYYAYIPTNSVALNDNQTVLQLKNSVNYVGFSLFYTV